MEDRQLIRLHPGERRELPLPGMGAAGYQWSFEIVRGADVVEVARRQASEREGESDVGTPGLPAGASVPEEFVIGARASGRATIRFRQTRSWEAGAEPLAERVVDVEVSDEAAEPRPVRPRPAR